MIWWFDNPLMTLKPFILGRLLWGTQWNETCPLVFVLITSPQCQKKKGDRAAQVQAFTCHILMRFERIPCRLISSRFIQVLDGIANGHNAANATCPQGSFRLWSTTNQRAGKHFQPCLRAGIWWFVFSKFKRTWIYKCLEIKTYTVDNDLILWWQAFHNRKQHLNWAIHQARTHLALSSGALFQNDLRDMPCE